MPTVINRIGLISACALGSAYLVACGDGDGGSLEDEREREIAGVAELATNAYAAAGPVGLYDYLSPLVTKNCSMQGLKEALKNEPVPDGFRRLKNTSLEPQGVSTTVVQVIGQDEVEVRWTFSPVHVGAASATDGPVVWRIVYLSGLERCAN